VGVSSYRYSVATMSLSCTVSTLGNVFIDWPPELLTGLTDWLSGKTRLGNDLLCVEWDVILTHSLARSLTQSNRVIILPCTGP